LAALKSQPDECAILVKALPHLSSNYYETVCCAGVGRDGKWRRQYPIPFRVLEDPQRFKRWEWIRYDYTAPSNDDRRESQKVVPESIQVAATMPVSERAKLLNPLIRASSKDAQA
jgi:hypothetical protein